MRPPFDPQIDRALEELSAIVVTSMTEAEIPQVRQIGAEIPLADLTVHGALSRTEYQVEGKGGPIAVSVYLPVGAKRDVPAIVHLHGGGLFTGTRDSDVPGIAPMAVATGLAIVAIEYRLAPEHPYPAALDDVLSALEWLVGEDGPAGIDTDRLILEGVSAGGGLAATTSLYLRDHGGPQLAALMLLCPMLDNESSSGSARQMAGAGSWDAVANATAWNAYLVEVLPGEVPPYAAAARATDLSGLPPVFIDVASAETFRDECVDFAGAIWRDGGEAELHVWPGGTHAFDFLAPWATLSQDARQARLTWLRRILNRI